MKTSADILAEAISSFIKDNELNSLGDGRRIYDSPLLAFALAEDPLFNELKKEQVVGAAHRLPRDWLPNAATAISYFLPFTEELRVSNHRQGLASEEWLRGRYQGEALNNRLREYLVHLLVASGAQALAPALEKDLAIDHNLYRSNWSERHVAYIAGLGTFGLSRGLITERGIAGRFGSVITTRKFEPSHRPYSSPFANCPFLVDESCGACIDRCPVGAISAEGKDKKKCHQYIFISDPLAALRTRYHYPGSACGKCQTSVPCEGSIPG